MIQIVRDLAGRVKRWAQGKWRYAGLPRDAGVRGPVRRVKGYQGLPQLALAPERATAQEPGMLDLPAAVAG